MTDTRNHAPTDAPAPVDLHKEVLEEKRFVTNRISETTRYLGFGLLASFYAIISSADAYPRALATAYPLALQTMALAGMLAVVFDYLQYLFGRVAVQNALKRTDNPYAYNKKWFSWRAREVCFWAKQAMALLGSALLIGVIVLGPSTGLAP